MKINLNKILKNSALLAVILFILYWITSPIIKYSLVNDCIVNTNSQLKIMSEFRSEIQTEVDSSPEKFGACTKEELKELSNNFKDNLNNIVNPDPNFIKKPTLANNQCETAYQITSYRIKELRPDLSWGLDNKIKNLGGIRLYCEKKYTWLR